MIVTLAFDCIALAGCVALIGRNDDGSPVAVPVAATSPCVGSLASSTATVSNGAPGAPEIATGFSGAKDPVYTKTFMAVTANPIASKVACDVLAKGGTAVDAAVATQMALNLVEPQSSGIGGGAFMLYYDGATKAVQSYDGRETAPAAATPNYLRYVDDLTDQTLPKPDARRSGRSIGTPGVLRLLELAYHDHGRLAWRDLFQPGIDIATNGFAIGPRMAASIDASKTDLKRDPDAAAYFLNADGSGKAFGTLLKNPALADTFRAIADNGAGAFYSGAIGQAIIAKVNDTTGNITTGKTTLADLAAYQSKRRDPICTTYRNTYYICGMGPPSSGGITVAAALGILENFNLAQYVPTALDKNGGRPVVLGVHLVAESERLAYADRDKYIADTDFVPLPGGSANTLLNKPYLASRAALISLTRSLGIAPAGTLGPVSFGVANVEEHGTTHMVITDIYGNAVSMTTTVESAFGSFHMARGFILNNQLTDFSAAPTDASGAPIANRVAAGKRPRSSMAPTLVFKVTADGSRGDFVMATGSPGGSTIIQYVTKTLVGALDWGLDAQQAVSMIDFGTANNPTTNVGGEHPNVDANNNGANDPLVTGLRALGHTVSVAAQSSGLSSIRRATVQGQPGFIGGADPRREGVVQGDVTTP